MRIIVLVLAGLGVLWGADIADNYYGNQRQIEDRYRRGVIDRDVRFVPADTERFLKETPFNFYQGRYFADFQDRDFSHRGKFEFSPEPRKAMDIASLAGAVGRRWQVLLLTSSNGPYLPGVTVKTLGMTSEYSRYSRYNARHHIRMCSFISELSYHTRGLGVSMLLVDVDGGVDPECYGRQLLVPDAVHTAEHLSVAAIFSGGRAYRLPGDEAKASAAAWVDVSILNKSDFGLAGRNLIMGSPSNVYPIFALISPSGRLVGYVRGKHKARHLAAALIRQMMSDSEWSSSSDVLAGFSGIYSEDMLRELEEHNDGDRFTDVINAALHTFGVDPIYDDNNYYPVAKREWPKDRFNRPMASDLFWMLVKDRSGPSLEDLKGFYEEANKDERFRQMMNQTYKGAIKEQQQ